ncbi:MAG: hypothetical protein V2A76_00765 [Planctomycetota bacterium]
MSDARPVTLGHVFRLWLPLAGSWLMMGVETPALTAFVARMANPELNLASWGSLVFPISLVIEGPIIMLLAASTALAVDRSSFQKLTRYMVVMSLALTLIHVAVAFTPLFDFVAGRLLGVPEEVHEAGRLGLRIMTPWTAAIAWRRLNQGVLIRAGMSRAVLFGTVVRMTTLLVLLAGGSLLEIGPGIRVGATAVAVAVSLEALYAFWAVRQVPDEAFSKESPRDAAPLTVATFASFYIPLALTPLLTLIIQPAGAAAMSRMPLTLESLAAWPAVHGLVFLLRGVGFAFNEVVVALAGEPGGKRALRRFAGMLAAVTVTLLAIIGLTPLGEIWFGKVSGLSDTLTGISSTAILIAVLMPGYQVFQSWYQGLLVHHRRTRAVSEAVALYVCLALLGLFLGTRFATIAGIHWAIGTFVFSGLCQTWWLRHRARACLAA